MISNTENSLLQLQKDYFSRPTPLLLHSSRDHLNKPEHLPDINERQGVTRVF